MQRTPSSPAGETAAMKLEDFGELQARYKAMKLAERGKAVIAYAEPALQTADRMLAELAGHDMKKIFAAIRKNAAIAGKMRPSGAKNMLMDASSDFLEGTCHKLAAWRRTMERVSQGEDIVSDKGREYIPMDAPLALALHGIADISSYLSVIQLALMEMAKQDAGNADAHRSAINSIRRCATLLSDCENASGIAASISN